MTYKAYPTKKDTASRLIRKGSRCSVFIFNRKIRKLQKKAARLARREVA